MKNLGLSKDYDDILINEHINGGALKTMITGNDWKEIGVTKNGDQRCLISGVKSLFNIN